MGSRFFRHGELPLVILALLEQRPMHGYQILVEIDRLFGGDYEPSTGTIYPAIIALKEERLIESEQVGRRTTYLPTELGKKSLAGRTDRLADLELRTGARLRPNGSVDSLLAQFTAQVRTLTAQLDPETSRNAKRLLERRLTKHILDLKRITQTRGNSR